MKRFRLAFRAAVFAALLALCLTGQTKKQAHAFIDKAALVDFVTPGLVITINSAAIASNGTITVTYTLTDPNGLPLDASGATTPGRNTRIVVVNRREIPAGLIVVWPGSPAINRRASVNCSYGTHPDGHFHQPR